MHVKIESIKSKNLPPSPPGHPTILLSQYDFTTAGASYTNSEHKNHIFKKTIKANTFFPTCLSQHTCTEKPKIRQMQKSIAISDQVGSPRGSYHNFPLYPRHHVQHSRDIKKKIFSIHLFPHLFCDKSLYIAKRSTMKDKQKATIQHLKVEKKRE